MKERLKRLYDNGNGPLGVDGLLKAVSNGFITVHDMIELVGGDDSEEGQVKATQVIKAAKIKEISTACNAVIVSGFDIELNGESVHFNLSIEDQSNIANLFRVVELGGTEFPYQADGGVCRIYSAQEIAQIYIQSQTLITTQTTYHNALKAYVQSLDDADTIAAVTYGMTLPEAYAAQVMEKLNVAQTQMTAILARLGDTGETSR